LVKAGGTSPEQTVADTCPIVPELVISFKNMSKVCVAVQPAAVSAKTDTETVVDNTGEGVNTFEVLTCWDIPPTEKV
jgi:hypothetical protein|tara:strand:- start:69 stop:299 length:231 start_codon:yes stop_codon:yes gene_type:complete